MKAISYIAAALVAALMAVAGSGYLYITHRVSGSFFDADGVRIHYTDEGDGEPVILLHGFAVNADLNWRRPGVTQKLARSFRVIAPDLRGHGKSDKPQDVGRYGVQMAKDAIRLMDHLNIRRAHVVGYSLGGFLALRLAIDHPDRLITASPLGAGWERPEASAFFKALEQFADALRDGKGIPPVSGGLGPGREKPGRLHTAWVKLMTGHFNDRQAMISVIESLPGLAATEKQVQSISVPVCSIVGDRDPLRLGANNLVGRVPDHTLVIIENADHIQAPFRASFIDSLRRFLRSHPDGAAPPK